MRIAQPEYRDPEQGEIGFLESHRVSTDSWRVHAEEIPNPDHKTVRYRFQTPKGTLGMVLQSNDQTAWVAEHLVKDKNDIGLIAEFVTTPTCDVAEVNRVAESYGERALIRGHIPCFDVFGQPGCWQDACCLAGTQRIPLSQHYRMKPSPTRGFPGTRHPPAGPA